MSNFIFLLKETWQGKSAIRSFLNLRLRSELLTGKILDLGSGGSDRYSETIPQAEGAEYQLFDLKKGQKVDFESDRLPYEDKSLDTVLLFNVLEHIYNHRHLLEEIRRIKTKEGTFIGFVPFLMWYHPDHHDYYRYTHEALLCTLTDTGYVDIKIETIYFGPYITAFQMIHTTLPRVLRPIFFTFFYGIDVIFRKIRPGGAERYALGYYFKAH